MARHRTIKPEFFTSGQIAECSTSARLLFIGLWCFCDDGGVHPASAVRLKMEVFPADSISVGDVESMVNELKSRGLLDSYVVDGKEFWRVTGWHHQKIDRPTYIYPRSQEFGEHSTSIRRGVAEPSRPKGEEGRRAESNGEEKKFHSRKEPIGADPSPPVGQSRGKFSSSGGKPRADLLDLSGVDWEAVTAMAEAAGRKVPPRTEADRRAWLRYAVMAAVTFSEGWLIGAAEQANVADTKKTRQAHFVAVLKATAKDAGVDGETFNGIAGRIEIPAAVWKSSVLTVPKGGPR